MTATSKVWAQRGKAKRVQRRAAARMMGLDQCTSECGGAVAGEGGLLNGRKANALPCESVDLWGDQTHDVRFRPDVIDER